MNMQDVIVIGGGTAGLTAAIYLQRSALQCVVLEGDNFGGRIFPTLAIDNYPGLPGISGYDYSEKLREQAKDLGADLQSKTAIALMRDGNLWKVTTRDGELVANAIVYAAGEKQRLLGIPGESELLGKGVATCAACDGAFFRKKDVVIVGGGDKALDDALTLSRICTSVHLIHRRDEFRAAGSTVAKVQAADNITLHLNSVLKRINGTNRVEGATIGSVDGSTQTELEVSGVFIAVGSDPLTELCAKYVELDEQGYILAGEDCRTNEPGLFVAGDVRRKPLRQLVTAAADGAVAGQAAAQYIIHNKQ